MNKLIAVADKEKVQNMQAFLRKQSTFWINNNFVVFFPINAHRHALISSINQVWKNCNLWHFYILTNHVNLQIFFNPENLLAKKNQLFPCLLLCSPLSITIYNKVDTRRGWEIQILHPYFILFGDQKKVCLFSKI